MYAATALLTRRTALAASTSSGLRLQQASTTRAFASKASRAKGRASAPGPASAKLAAEADKAAEQPAPTSEDASASAPKESEAPQPLPTLSALDFTSSLADAQKVSAPSGPDGPQRTGARSATNSMSSIERRQRNLARFALAGLAVGVGIFTWSLGNQWTVDEVKEKKWRHEEVPLTRLERTKIRFQDIFNVFSEPQWQELLPAPLPAPHQKPMTLVLSLDDLLVTSTWDRAYGWRTAKRPGVDYFLAYLSQFYEIVIWTTQHHYTASPIIDKLDPYRFFTMYHLFRESTKSVNGEPVKDLSYLNRDLSKVIIVDTHPEHVRTHPGNAVVLPKWDGKPNDRGLIAIIPFLESIGIYKPEDVRSILQAYQGKDVPLEYAKAEAAAKELHVAEYNARRASGSARGLGAGSFTLSSLFSSNGPTSAVPPTYLEQKRAEAQQVYRDEQRYIAENKENFERLIEEDRQAAMREGAGSLLGAMQAITGNTPPPAAPASAADAAAAPGAGSTVATPATA